MKKKALIFFIVAFATLIAAYLIGVKYISKNGIDDVKQNIISSGNSFPVSVNNNALTNKGEKNIPLDRAGDRVNKKPFGIFITPQNSPVQPERFRGYHAGADFEIFPGEEDIDIPVRAVCSGKLRIKRYVNGYGGVVIQDCQIQGENITVLYGHLSLSSIKQEVESEILEMGIIGNLGNPSKGETDGERKHLHLGIHKGNDIDLRGYVSSPDELAGWIDPCLYFCK